MFLPVLRKLSDSCLKVLAVLLRVILITKFGVRKDFFPKVSLTKKVGFLLSNVACSILLFLGSSEHVLTNCFPVIIVIGH